MRMLVLDGNSIVNRAFYGIRHLSTKDGHYTNAIVGFLNILQKLQAAASPDHVAVAFDLSAPTFRHKMYEGYKQGRRKMPDELRQQLPVLKELLSLMGYTIVEKEGYEADDILGTLSASVQKDGGDCFLATGDRDSLQLVGDHVSVYLTTTKMGKPDTTVYDRSAIQEKYGLTPDQLIDLKALMGDASDKIPGVPGIGEKTALDLLHKFGSLDGVYENLETSDLRDNVRKKLTDGKESAYLSYRLGTICRTAPIDTTAAAYELRPADNAALAPLLAKLELFKLMDKLGISGAAVSPASAEKSPSEQSPPAAVVPPLVAASEEEVLAAARQSRQLSLLTDWEAGEPTACVFMSGGKLAETDIPSPALVEILTDESVAKRTHDCKPLFRWMKRHDCEPAGFTMDTMLAAYLLNPLSSDYDLSHLAQEYGVPAAECPECDKVSPTAAVFDGLCAVLEAKIAEQSMTELLTQMEIPLAAVLADIENQGVCVDRAGLMCFSDVVSEKITRLEQTITNAVGYSFNLNSPKQLGKALFEDLGLPAKKKTKTGYSTNADVLESLRDAHPVVAMLLEYRLLAKLKSTYCDGLLKVIGDDGRIRSTFNQTETRTGRISSTDPNLQNIPVRQELGRELRKFFTAQDGWTLCDADYSQIELRVMASMADEDTMIHAFNTGEDIHRMTAAQVFGVPEELVTPQMRSSAKAVNFGIIYGIGAHSLSEDIGATYGEAKRYIEGYLSHYSKVAGFMEQLIADAKEKGYSETLYHRRRPLPELANSNHITKAFGERVARNMPIQGTAADIIKLAMIRVSKRLRAEHLRTRLILQVHDELIVEAPLEEQEQASRILKEEMEAAATMKVCLSVDVHSGKTWFAAKG